MNRQTLIFEAIRQLLEEREMDSVTVAAIAEKCHLHVNTVNYYFKGKADMMMRFHAYLTSVRTSGLPESYYSVPVDEADAVKALIEVIDLELFRVDYSTKAQIKLFLYLFGNMLAEPKIRDYLVSKQQDYTKFFHGVLNRYIRAGIANTETLDEALTSFSIISTGYTFSHYYYDQLPPSIHLRYERRRLLFMLVVPKHHGLLGRILDE